MTSMLFSTSSIIEKTTFWVGFFSTLDFSTYFFLLFPSSYFFSVIIFLAGLVDFLDEVFFDFNTVFFSYAFFFDFLADFLLLVETTSFNTSF